MPSIKSRVPWEKGGYLVRTNAAGFRSDSKFVKERTPGIFRAILFGDSQTAGNGVSNSQRYSDVVTQLVPNLEVFNYGLPGTGPRTLPYVARCVNVDHDLLVIGMHVENIGQLASRFHVFTRRDGHEVIYAKPYFTLDHGDLALHHVPVPGRR